MSLLVATPMYAGICQAEHFKSCLDLKEALVRGGLDHGWLVSTNDSLITRARNTLAARFLKTDYRKLLFIDGDISFSPESVAALWNFSCDENKGVVCGAYRMKTPESKLTVWKDGKLMEPDFDQPTTVDYAGTGFMMIDHQVFDILMRRHPEWRYEEGERGECWAFFQDVIHTHSDGTRYHESEDYFFCRSWRETGGQIWWLPDIKLGHWGLYEYRS